MSSLRLEPLSESNFEKFTTIINCEDAGCYCSFWHQKWSSMEEWDKRKAEEPEKNKSCMLERIRSRFHVGVLVYRDADIVAWVSVGPMPDFYWEWKRVGLVGDNSKTVAIIHVSPERQSTGTKLPRPQFFKNSEHRGKSKAGRRLRDTLLIKKRLTVSAKKLLGLGFLKI